MIFSLGFSTYLRAFKNRDFRNILSKYFINSDVLVIRDIDRASEFFSVKISDLNSLEGGQEFIDFIKFPNWDSFDVAFIEVKGDCIHNGEPHGYLFAQGFGGGELKNLDLPIPTRCLQKVEEGMFKGND